MLKTETDCNKLLFQIYLTFGKMNIATKDVNKKKETETLLYRNNLIQVLTSTLYQYFDF